MAEGGIARYMFGDAVAVIVLPRRGYSRRPTPRRASTPYVPLAGGTKPAASVSLSPPPEDTRAAR